VQYYRTTQLFLQSPSETAPDRRLTTHEVRTDTGDAAHDRQLPMPPRRGRREA
jgi:hypothetical protein